MTGFTFLISQPPDRRSGCVEAGRKYGAEPRAVHLAGRPRPEIYDGLMKQEGKVHVKRARGFA